MNPASRIITLRITLIQTVEDRRVVRDWKLQTVISCREGGHTTTQDCRFYFSTAKRLTFLRARFRVVPRPSLPRRKATLPLSDVREGRSDLVGRGHLMSETGQRLLEPFSPHTEQLSL
ncbi:hypothetical protein SRHO_G00000700 [Serrasalmus rhombeus]